MGMNREKTGGLAQFLREAARFSWAQGNVVQFNQDLAIIEVDSDVWLGLSRPESFVTFGAWLSLVERLVRDQEAGGSNPLAPTISFPSSLTMSEWCV